MRTAVRIGHRLAASATLLLLTLSAVAVADPTVSAVAQPNPVEIGQTVSFSANAATDPGASIIGYDWDFGDGDTCFDCGPSTSYIYPQAGQYTVTVTVTDSNFATASGATEIDVTPVPPLPPSSGPPSSGIHGGAGEITLGGRIGSLQLDLSNQSDVLAFAGVPDATGAGNFDAIPHGPNYFALGYACDANAGNGLNVNGSAFCKTVFYINTRTQRLVAFDSSSRFYSFRRASPGMATSRAQRKMRRIAQGGCLTGFFFFDRRNHASLFGEVDGGHTTSHGHGSNTILRITGGHVGALQLESNRHPVGLLFC